MLWIIWMWLIPRVSTPVRLEIWMKSFSSLKRPSPVFSSWWIEVHDKYRVYFWMNGNRQVKVTFFELQNLQFKIGIQIVAKACSDNFLEQSEGVKEDISLTDACYFRVAAICLTLSQKLHTIIAIEMATMVRLNWDVEFWWPFFCTWPEITEAFKQMIYHSK